MLQISPMNKPFAAEVTGIDLNHATDDIFRQLHAAWLTYPVLVIRDQDISVAVQQAVAERFGKLKTRARKDSHQGATKSDNPYVMLVSNIRDDKGKLIGSSPKGALAYHSDSAFDDIPAKASLLYGIELPKSGGDTLFVSMYDIYDALDAETKALLADKWGVNYHLPSLPLDPNQSNEERIRTARRAAHPMVIAHPETGRPVLYVNRLMTRDIAGVPSAQATSLLERLFQMIEDPKFVYAHKWRQGDLVIWDNRCLQHGRSDFDPAERRLLRRFAVFCDDRPKAYSASCGQRPDVSPAAAQ